MLESGAQSRGQLSPSEIGGLIDRHFVSDIQNKLSLLNFNMAFYIAEEVIEKVVDLLQAKYKELKTLVSLSLYYKVMLTEAIIIENCLLFMQCLFQVSSPRIYLQLNGWFLKKTIFKKSGFTFYII